MNREDIIRMAQEAGAIHYWHLSNLERFASLVASAERESLRESFRVVTAAEASAAILHEREACALIALEKETIRKDTEKAHYRLSDLPFNPKQFGFDGGAIFEGRRIADKIRARGQA